MNKVIFFLVLLLIGSGVLFLYFNQNDNAEVIDVVKKVETRLPSKKKLPVSDAASALSHDVTGLVPSENITRSPVSSIGERGEGGSAAVTERTESKLESELAPESEPVDDGVPDSYPIEEAELYFVPREDRYPGNIGGPPPLNLPDPDFEPVIEEGIPGSDLPGSR